VVSASKVIEWTPGRGKNSVEFRQTVKNGARSYVGVVEKK